MLSSNAYIALVNIRDGRQVNTSTAAVRDLLRAGVVTLIGTIGRAGSDRAEVIDSALCAELLAEREAFDRKAIGRFTSSLGIRQAEPASADARAARLSETRDRVRVLATHKAPTISVQVSDLLVLLEAADVMLDGATQAELAEWEDAQDRNIAAHEIALAEQADA